MMSLSDGPCRVLVKLYMREERGSKARPLRTSLQGNLIFLLQCIPGDLRIHADVVISDVNNSRMHSQKSFLGLDSMCSHSLL